MLAWIVDLRKKETIPSPVLYNTCKTSVVPVAPYEGEQFRGRSRFNVKPSVHYTTKMVLTRGEGPKEDRCYS